MSVNYKDILNHAAAGNWDLAHQQIQNSSEPMACLIHAYLHREEGDLSNAQYWYDRANSPFPDNSLEQEFERLVALLEEQE